MKVAPKEELATPKAGQTPLAGLVAESKILTPEDYAFGNQAALSSRISEKTLTRLRDFSITTQEELLGYLEVPDFDASAFGRMVESSPLAVPHLVNHLKVTSNPAIVEGFDAVKKEEYAFGALLPPAGTEIPEPASSKSAQSETIEPTDDSSLLSRPCLPTIKDQGNRGTCVAFVTCAVLEFAYCIHRGQALDVSEQFQFWHCKQHDGSPASDGTWPHVSFALVGANGICDEAEWTYNPTPLPGNISHEPPGPSLRIDPRPPNTPTALFTGVTAALTISPPTDVAKIKGYVSTGHAVAVAIPVFNSWAANPYTRLTGNIPMPLPGEPRKGGHAIVLIGWANDPSFAGGGYFVVRNSWGTRWGSTSVFGAGHGTIPFDFISTFNQFAHTVKV